MDEIINDIYEIFPLLLHQFREAIGNSTLLAISVILIFGYIFGKLAEKFKLPIVTGYIIAGILLGESIGKIIELKVVHSLRPITQVALGLIALAIGGEFTQAKMKSLGKKIFVITIFQVLFTFIVTTIFLTVFGLDFKFSLILGAIATATAPAATIAIIQGLRARGKFIDYLYGLVALDDAGSVILFAIVFAFVSIFLPQVNGNASAFTMIIHSFLEIILSVVIGFIVGYILHKITHKKQNTSEIMIISLGIIFAIISIAHKISISPLITNIVIGATLVNLAVRNQRISQILGKMTPPIYAAFFTIAGTELQLGIFSNPNIIFLGIVFVIARALGKYSGVYLGSALTKTGKSSQKYLGYCMLPQAGVSLGLILLIQSSPVIANSTPEIQSLAITMVNIVIFSVFVNELVGPVLSKWAIINGAKLNSYDM